MGCTARWLAWLLLLVTACKPAPHASPALPADASILLIVLDACRADKLGSYGFRRDTTPVIDAFARDPDAIVFRRHYVQGSWTKPSTASLFTGLYVHQHGLSMSHQKTASAGRPIKNQVLAESFQTMAESLRDAGFVTVGVVKSMHLLPANGFAQGFTAYYTPQNTPSADRRLAERFVAALHEHPRRVFAYLHLNACHNPFPPSDRDPDYMARYSFPYDEAARKAAGVDFTTADIKHTIARGGVRLDAADQRFLQLIYEAKLRWTDRNLVGPLLQALRKSERYDNSLAIITADHGEELYEHQGYAHGHALWEPIIHVPLIVKFPKGHKPTTLPSTVNVPTKTIDLLPSLLELLGVPRPPDLPGRPIFQAADGGYAFSEQGAPSGAIEQRALVEGDYKFLDAPPTARLFNLRADPAEQSDLTAAEPERAASMRSTVQSLSGTPFTAPVVEQQLAPEVIEQLRRLGYLEPNK